MQQFDSVQLQSCCFRLEMAFNFFGGLTNVGGLATT